MIVSSVQDEMSPSWFDSSLESVAMDQVVEKLKVRAGFGDKTKDVVASYAQAFPGSGPAGGSHIAGRA